MLDPFDPWEYFGTSKTAALTALRARLGTTYATTPDDAGLLEALRRAVDLVHRATDRSFLLRRGSFDLDGTDAATLWLPLPVVSVAQGGSGVTGVRISGDDEDVDPDAYRVTEGAWSGADDPRQNPRVVLQASTWTGLRRFARWPAGTANVRVTGTFGYLEEDGCTPEPILHALARLVVWTLPKADAVEDLEDRKRAALVQEQVRGRSYTLGAHAAGAGLTMDREVDAILRSYRRPAQATISRPARASRSRYL